MRMVKHLCPFIPIFFGGIIKAEASIQSIAGPVFKPGGAGFAIIQLMLIAAVGSLAGYIASAVGKGQIAGFIKMTTVFSCIGVVAAQILAAINTFAKLIGA